MRATAAQLAQQRGSAAFDFRASRARVVRRSSAGDTPTICSGCGTEVDVDAPAHAPSCRYFDVVAPEVKTEGIHTAAGSLTAKEMQRRHQEHLDQRPTTTACAHEDCDFHFEGTLVECREKFEAHRRLKHPNVRSSRGVADREIERVRAEAAARAQQRALRALDDGEPQSALEESTSVFAASDEVEEPEDRPAEADADTTTSVGGQDAEGADGAIPADGRVGGTVIRYSANGRRLTPWSRQECIALVQGWADSHAGEPPVLTDWFGVPGFPSAPSYTRLFGGWAAMIEAAGYERPTRARRRKDSSGFASRAGISGPVSSPDEQQPTGTAATADGSGGAGVATPAPDPEVVREAPPGLTIAALPLEQLAAVSAIVAAAARALTPFARTARGPLWQIATGIVEQAIAE